jgi:hypothetical protein
MASRILTKGLRTGIGAGGVRFIIMRGLVSDLNPPDPSEDRLIIIAIINQLKTISVTRGFFTDINSCVYDWQFTNIPVDSLPCIEVKDIDDSSEARGLYNYKSLTVEIIGKIAIDDMDTARNFRQDIESVMALGPLYPDSVYLSKFVGRSDITPEQKNKKAVNFTMNYEVKYRTKIL